MTVCNGVKVLYPTFVNLGEKPTLEGDGESSLKQKLV